MNYVALSADININWITIQGWFQNFKLAMTYRWCYYKRVCFGDNKRCQMFWKWKKVVIISTEISWLRHTNIFWDVWIWILKFRNVTKQLCQKIIQQEREYNQDNKIKEIKNRITRTKLARYHQILVDVRAHVNENQQRLNYINQDPGASILILSLLLEDQG